MMADEFIKLVHRVQDITASFDKLEESKTEVDLNWIWNADSIIESIPSIFNLPNPEEETKLEVDSKLINPEKDSQFIKKKCFKGRKFTMKKIFRGTIDGFTA